MLIREFDDTPAGLNVERGTEVIRPRSHRGRKLAWCQVGRAGLTQESDVETAGVKFDTRRAVGSYRESRSAPQV